MPLSDILSITLVSLGAAFYAFIGVNALWRPKHVLRAFDLVAQTPAARNEIRAVYGGLTLAMSASLLNGLFYGAGFVVFLTIASITLAIALARLTSAVIDRAFAPAPRLWTLLEFLVAGALFAAGALRSGALHAYLPHWM